MTRQTVLVQSAFVLSLAHLAVASAQPFLGGVMLGGGDFDAFSAHSWNGRLAFVVCGLVLAAILAAWREKALSAAFPGSTLALLALEGWQIHLGFVDNLLWHIPLGSLVVAGAAVLAHALFRTSARARSV